MGFNNFRWGYKLCLCKMLFFLSFFFFFQDLLNMLHSTGCHEFQTKRVIANYRGVRKIVHCNIIQDLENKLYSKYSPIDQNISNILHCNSVK